MDQHDVDLMGGTKRMMNFHMLLNGASVTKNIFLKLNHSRYYSF